MGQVFSNNIMHEVMVMFDVSLIVIVAVASFVLQLDTWK